MSNRVEPTRYRCPKCGSNDITAEVNIIVTVEQREDREPYPVIENLDLGTGFDDDDTMFCDECGNQEKAAEFVVRERQPLEI